MSKIKCTGECGERKKPEEFSVYFGERNSECKKCATARSINNYKARVKSQDYVHEDPFRRCAKR